MTALFIGPEQKSDIARLRALAASAALDADEILRLRFRDPKAFDDFARQHTTGLPLGYVVTFTHERQPKAPPPGLCAHISINVIYDNMLPSPEAVEAILSEFGMPPRRDCNAVWIEDVSATIRAVNVLALLSGSGDAA